MINEYLKFRNGELTEEEIKNHPAATGNTDQVAFHIRGRGDDLNSSVRFDRVDGETVVTMRHSIGRDEDWIKPLCFTFVEAEGELSEKR